MTIYYSLIARDTTVLVDHSENTGNFQQIAQTILAKAPRQDTKCTYISGSYHFHVMVQENLIYICMTDEEMGKRLPYMFLEEIKRRFCVGSLKQRARTALSYELKRDFQQVLSSQMEAFNSRREGGASSDQLSRVRQDVEDVKGVMTQNIEKVLERGERIDTLLDKTEELDSSASTFRTNAVRVRRKMWWQNTKMCLILIAVILIILTVIVLVILGETGHLK
ncbi:vesicle-associated membrane protein 7-like [Xenia sp. Carnegie-2017]|uniref:vesicle-associated membrane protein 7-like n=1 Tax=Xenia sp. Carnegie-2017 TaxID=2897299 RepID=UPI001F03C8AE|nr:vesicle-associated membrane protein 7-like [Xenia sp. Carnegie-2017]